MGGIPICLVKSSQKLWQKTKFMQSGFRQSGKAYVLVKGWQQSFLNRVIEKKVTHHCAEWEASFMRLPAWAFSLKMQLHIYGTGRLSKH